WRKMPVCPSGRHRRESPPARSLQAAGGRARVPLAARRLARLVASRPNSSIFLYPLAGLRARGLGEFRLPGKGLCSGGKGVGEVAPQVDTAPFETQISRREI